MKQPDAHAEVQRLLGEIRQHANVFAENSKTRRAIECASDQIETITRAHMQPKADWFGWEDYGLTTSEARVAGMLQVKFGKTMTREAIMDALYWSRSADDVPLPKIVDVLVSKANKKLRAHNAPFIIDNVWGRGYRLIANSQGIPASYPADDTDILASRH